MLHLEALLKQPATTCQYITNHINLCSLFSASVLLLESTKNKNHFHLFWFAFFFICPLLNVQHCPSSLLVFFSLSSFQLILFLLQPISPHFSLALSWTLLPALSPLLLPPLPHRLLFLHFIIFFPLPARMSHHLCLNCTLPYFPPHPSPPNISLSLSCIHYHLLPPFPSSSLSLPSPLSSLSILE